MAPVFRADRPTIAKIMNRLVAEGGIDPDAQFDYEHPTRLRRTVGYRDLDFQHMAAYRPVGAPAPAEEGEWVPSPDVARQALERLVRNGFVAQDARLLTASPQRLAHEVLYRDLHFLYYLGLYAEESIAAGALQLLKSQGLVDPAASYAPAAFSALRQRVKSCFVVPETAISPVMERLLYLLAAVKRPQRLLALGIYCGNALVWCVGPACDPGRSYRAESAIGVDIDPSAIAQARSNFSGLAGADHVQLLAEDARVTVERLKGPFDTVYLDVLSPESGKAMYLELLEALYPKLSPGAWVLAHDTTLGCYGEQLAGYLQVVRDPARFRHSISFDIDALGLELSIR
jgi:predicted O-methyltransferase YrrM